MDALTPKGPVFNDALEYLHSMKLDYMTEAIASTDEFFREAQQVGREAIMSTKALDVFVRKLNGYDKSGGKNRIKSVLGDLDRKLMSRERDDLRQITKLDERDFERYLAAGKSPLTVYRGNGIGIDEHSLDDFEFQDIPAGGTRDVSMFGVVQHTHMNANLLKRRNFKDRYPGQFEILAPATIPASKMVSVTLCKKTDKGKVEEVDTVSR